MRTVISLPFRVLSPTTLGKSRNVDRPLPRRIKSFWKRLCAVFSTPRPRKDSSPDATSNPDQNVDGIGPSDSQEEILYQNISDNISEAIPDSLSELPFSTSSVVVSQVGPVDEHPSSQSSNASDDSGESDSEVSQSAIQTVQN